MALHRRIFQFCLLVFCLFSFQGIHAATWPFDQRQVLLVSIQGTEFPNDLTTAQIMDVFVERGRVRWITQRAGAGKLVPLEVPSDFVWSRGSAVRSLGLKYKADGIVVLIQDGSKIDMRWYSVTDGRPLYFESLYLPSSSGSSEQDLLRRDRLRAWLLDIWGTIPGRGYVVKRDIQYIYVEGVNAEGLKVGDRLKLLRLQDAKRHPVLKTLIGFESSETGFAKVVEIGDPFAKAQVEYESELDPIQDGDRYTIVQEVTKVEAKPEQKPEPETKSVVNVFGGGGAHVFDIQPRLGVGFLKYEEATSADSYSMRSVSYSAGIEFDVYLTKAWTIEVSHDFGTGKFGTPPSDYGSDAIASGWTNTNFLTGYQMSLGDYAGLEDGFVSFYGGYSRFQMKLDDGSLAVSPTAKKYSGISMGVEMGLPLDQQWTAIANFHRVFGAYMEETLKTSGASSGNTLWGFELLAKYKLDDKTDIGGGYGVTQASSTFEGSGTRTTPAVSSKASSSKFSLFYTIKM